MKTYTLFHSFKLTLVLLTLSLILGVGNTWGATLTCTFESVAGKSFPYDAAWTLGNGSENTSYHHGGSRCLQFSETTSVIIRTTNKINGTVTNVTFYAGRTSKNNTSTNVYIQTSTDGSTWTTQKTFDIATAGRVDQDNTNNWTTVSQDLKNVSNCYVRITRGGSSTAVRVIDDITITYTPAVSYTITATRNNDSYGTVSVDGTTITATPADCYQVISGTGGYTVTSGTASVSHTGTSNTLTVTPSTDCTVQVNFEKKIVNTYVDEIQGNDDIEDCGTHSAPALDDETYATSGTCAQQHWHFAGWTTAAYKASPEGHIIIAGTSMTANGTTYYAVWSKGVTSTFDGSTEGTYKIYATVSGTNYYATNTVSSNSLQTTTTAGSAQEFDFAISGDYWTISYTSGNNTYYLNADNSATINPFSTTSSTWKIASGTNGTWRIWSNSTNNGSSAYAYRALMLNSSHAFKNYCPSASYYDCEISSTEYSDYICTCCTPLGQINGSINLTQTETTMTVNDWTYNAGSTGTTESNVSSYTVKLYKLNGSSEWELANNTSNSGGTSGTAATRTGISWESKSVTWSGLEYGATYKVTVEAVGTGEYCNGAETAVTSVNGNELTNNEILWKYSIYLDNGTNTNSGWAHHWINSLSSNEGSVTVNNLSADATYKYKLTLGGIVWYSANATMTVNNCSNWTLYSNVSENCGMTAGLSGNYTFIVNTESPSVSVTYPLANQTAGYPIYFDKSVITEWTTAGTSDLYLRIGKSGNNKNNSTDDVSWSLVPGTDRFYQINSLAYNGFEAWQIANNASWSGNYSIYTVNGSGYEITKGTVFIKEVVGSTGMTVIPTTSKNTEDGCNYWNVSTSEGMLTHNVAVGSAEHGTVVATYTNTSGTANQTVAEGANAYLAHRCIVTITATPDEGYSCTALTVNEAAFTSGNTHILTANATIAATFTAQTSTVTLDNNDATSGSSQTVTATYDAAMPLTTTSSTSVAALSRTGYTFTGWWDAASDGTQYYSYNAGTSTLSSARTWNKTGAQTLKAQWSINSYTLTWATVRGKITTAGTGAAVDATGNVSSSVEYNTALTVPECGNSNGYTFSGWSPTPASNMPAENTTYTAQWTANEYTVTLNNQGATTAGAASVSATFAQDMPSIAGNLPEKTGYSFGGYFTNTNGGGTKYYNADGTSATNMALYGATPTLYAYWIAQISFSINGNIISTQAVTAALPSSATVPTSCGDCWAFAGWSTNSECSTAPEHAGGENAATHGITTPTTLYAVYRKGETAEYSTEPSCPTYTITWVVNGETYSTGTPTTSTNECTGITTLPTAPSNSTLDCADKFMGWSESTLTGTGNNAPDDLFTNAAGAPTIDENKTFYAVFAKATLNSEGSFEITASEIGSSYVTSESKLTKLATDDIGYKNLMYNTPNFDGLGWAGGQRMQFKNNSTNTGELYNKVAISGLSKIRIYDYSSSPSYLSVYTGASEKATTSTHSWPSPATGTESLSIPKNTSGTLSYTSSYYDFTVPSGHTYFYLKNNLSGTPYPIKIIVYYANYTYSDYVTGCCTAYTITGATTSGTVVIGGTLTSTYNSSCEGNDVKITATVNTGYRFNGWDITSGGSTVARKDGSAETEGGNPIYIFTMPSAAVTVSADIAKWTTTVTLDANEGTGADQTVTATYGDAMPLETISDEAIAMPTKTGAKLLGYWDTDASSGGTQYYAYDGSTLSSARTWDKEVGDVTLYARWMTVDYYIDDMHRTTGYTGAGMEKSGAGYTVPGPIDEKKTGNVCETEHYIFVGWVSADGQNTDGTLEGTPTIVQPGEVKNASGKTYYAVWAEE